MRETNVLLLVLAVLCLEAASADVHDEYTSCGCQNYRLCMPLGESARFYPDEQHSVKYQAKKSKQELFAFVEACNSSVWTKFDWEKLTTIALVGFYDLDLLCQAHQEGVKVVSLGNMAKSDLANSTARQLYIQEQVANAKTLHLDGINMDFEEPLDKNSVQSIGYTSLIQGLATAMHEAFAESQVSVDVAWSAADIDGRCYDYAALGRAADLLFVMAYDEQSQIWSGPCEAKANSPIQNARNGIKSYQELGIPNEKLVLGLPWYGYHYTCTQYFQNGTCLIAEVPFRGCNCSDAAGYEMALVDIQKLLTEHGTVAKWEAKTQTPYADIEVDGTHIQLRFDNFVSLFYKNEFARKEGLAGSGMWTANFLDYSDDEEAERLRNLMWDVML